MRLILAFVIAVGVWVSAHSAEAQSVAVNPECAVFEAPGTDPDPSWASGIDLTVGFASIKLCTPFETKSGFRLDPATYPTLVGACVVSIDGQEFRFTNITGPGQLVEVLFSTTVFDEDGQRMAEVWCESPTGTKGDPVTDVATVVPVSEAPTAPLLSAP